MEGKLGSAGRGATVTELGAHRAGVCLAEGLLKGQQEASSMRLAPTCLPSAAFRHLLPPSSAVQTQGWGHGERRPRCRLGLGPLSCDEQGLLPNPRLLPSAHPGTWGALLVSGPPHQLPVSWGKDPFGPSAGVPLPGHPLGLVPPVPRALSHIWSVEVGELRECI